MAQFVERRTTYSRRHDRRQGPTKTPFQFDIMQYLRNKGFKGVALAHSMPWFGDGNPKHYNPSVTYKSNDSHIVSLKFDLLQAANIGGVIMTWQGVKSSFGHSSTVAMHAEALKRGMLFALCLDPWVCKGKSNPQQVLIDALNDTTVKAMTASAAYLPEKYVLDFIGSSVWDGTYDDQAKTQQHMAKLDWQAIAAATGLSVLSRKVGYSWPQPLGSDGNVQTPSSAVAALAAQNANPAMKIPAICPRFFDGGWKQSDGSIDWNQQNWSPAAGPSAGPTRWLYDQAGNYWFDQMDNTPVSAPYVAIATLDDYNEGTMIEPNLSMMAGIRLK